MTHARVQYIEHLETMFRALVKALNASGQLVDVEERRLTAAELQNIATLLSMEASRLHLSRNASPAMDDALRTEVRVFLKRMLGPEAADA